MTTDPDRAALRFGYGLPGTDPGDLIAPLEGPDRAARRWPGVTPAALAPLVQTNRTAREAGDMTAFRDVRRAAAELARQAQAITLARAVGAADALRERLVAFWADHFTTAPRNGIEQVAPFLMVDAAIRPHVAGRFRDMLIAAVTHPAMLSYLDQNASFGPTSRKGLRGNRGLNENLARELLELHTLGVGAAYTQGDVRELAELLTGLSGRPHQGLVFDQARAEPGAETVLGVVYAGEGLDTVHRALSDLAARPETAAHLARKLVVHFVADDPDPALVGAVAARWRETDGDLLAVTRALVLHPLALAAPLRKARQPFDLIVAGLRALGVTPDRILAADRRAFHRLALGPMQAMGQPWGRPRGPDGWPEAEAFWITPQGLAARVTWAMTAPERLVKPLPDPRALVETALGSAAGDRLRWAAAAAESARDGVGLILASPEFNRR
jgi:uncharacterized protein (DUF1800 family)